MIKSFKAFTLAEVLLTLAVIGIVAAITLPSLMVDTTEKAFDAQRKALHARLAQAIGTMANLSGYGTCAEETTDANGNKVAEVDTAAAAFLYEGLSKVYKMNNICEPASTIADGIGKCGIPANIISQTGENIDFPINLRTLNSKLLDEVEGSTPDGAGSRRSSAINTYAAAFETINGESVAVFYNPNCKNISDGDYVNSIYQPYFYIQDRMCVNFIYDLNGLKGPNKVGRDIGFITALYAKNPEVVAPVPYDTDVSASSMTQAAAVEACAKYSDEARLPNKDELASMFFNVNLIGMGKTGYWSSSVVSPHYAQSQYFSNGARRTMVPRTDGSIFVRCVKK